MLGATTPETFYDNLTVDLIKDGFLGRCIIVESKRKRQLTQFVSRHPPHKRIIDWCNAVHQRWVIDGITIDASPPDQEPKIIDLPLDHECINELGVIEEEINQAKDVAEGDSMDMLLVRTLEKSIRLSMIAAKARDIHARTVGVNDLRWAYQYVKHYDNLVIGAIKKNRSVNEYDALMKKAVDIIKSAPRLASNPKLSKFAAVFAGGGMPHNELLRRMHMKSSEFTGMIETAVEARIITRAPGISLGYAGLVYYCVEE